MRPRSKKKQPLDLRLLATLLLVNACMAGLLVGVAFVAVPQQGRLLSVALIGRMAFVGLNTPHTAGLGGRCSLHIRGGHPERANPMFHLKPVPLFSDLLLHDVGTGDGIEQDDAKGSEIRTPALWGPRFRRPLLHDGSAATIEDAVRLH